MLIRPPPRTAAPAAAAQRAGRRRTPPPRPQAAARSSGSATSITGSSDHRLLRTHLQNALDRPPSTAGTPCAAPRGGRPHRPAPPAAPPVQRPGQPQRDGDVVGRARALQLAEEPQRRCANDNGTTSGRARPPTRHGPYPRPASRVASPATVGASNNARNGTSTPSTVRMRLTSRVASSECPPSSKKLSSTPTREDRAPPRTPRTGSPPGTCAGARYAPAPPAA